MEKDYDNTYIFFWLLHAGLYHVMKSIYLYVLFSVYLCAQPKPTLFIYRSIPLLIYIVKQKSKVIVLIAFL